MITSNKKIISFDVGIINLAFCIMEYKNKVLNIIDWNIINLLIDDNEEIIKCDMNNNNNSCGNIAKYEVYIKNKVEYKLCCKHKKHSKILKLENEELNKTLLIGKISKSQNKEKCNYDLCNKNSIYFINNNKYCTYHYKTQIKKINDFEVRIIKKKSIKDLSTDKLKFNLICKLDELKYKILNVDEVLIENQPTFKNPKMKGLSDTLYTWFMIRGINDKIINNSKINKIMFISPSNKLKDFIVQEQINSQNNDTDKYKITKKLGIDSCKILLEKFNLVDWIHYLLQFKKKDDLTDCLLQGWYYFNKDDITKKIRILKKNNII